MGKRGRLGCASRIGTDRVQCVPFAPPAIHELGDALPGTRITQEIQPIATTVAGVIDIEKCFVRKMGFDYYVDLHVVVDGNLPVRRGHEIAHQVKDAIQLAYPRVADVLVHIEPNER